MHATRPAALAATLALLAPLAAQAYQASQGPTELLLWDATRAYEGYTLFAAHGTTYLIDMSGSVVHTWKGGTNPKLLPNGHVLDASKDDPSLRDPSTGSVTAAERWGSALNLASITGILGHLGLLVTQPSRPCGPPQRQLDLA